MYPTGEAACGVTTEPRKSPVGILQDVRHGNQAGVNKAKNSSQSRSSANPLIGAAYVMIFDIS
jgi:hypothetical protein